MRRLIIRPGAIGDYIVSFPALESLRAAYTEVWVPGCVVPLVRFADRVRSIASTGLDLAGLEDVEPPAGLLDALAWFDSIICWYGTGRAEFRRAVAHLPFRFFPTLPPWGADRHAVDFYLEQAYSAGGATVDAVPRIPRPPERRDFAVIHPFSGSPSKNWPLANYRALAARLDGRLPVGWCAGPEDVLDGAVRIEDLYELACWLGSARVYVGNDSGITHLAAAAGVPTVAIFGPTDPAVWAPRGPAVRVVATARPGESVAQVSIEAVWSAIESVV